MENKRVLFITFDMSGYYDSMYEELKKRYTHVDYYNTANYSFKYQNFGQRIRVLLYKVFSRVKLKNYYKYKELVKKLIIKEYDITLVIRPDVMVDSQLLKLRSVSKKFIAYYHDSINNIKRKKEVIHFFDEVYSYEMEDVKKYNLSFIPNFIYTEPGDTEWPAACDAFSVMSDDYRVPLLRKVAMALKNKGCSYNFYVMKKNAPPQCNFISYIKKRLDNEGVVEKIKEAKIIVDIHKFGVQDGLTFRVFEAMAFHKKLITTNTDIVNYNFYDPQNICVIEDGEDLNIPDSFINTPYKPVPYGIYKRYTVSAWLDTVLGGKKVPQSYYRNDAEKSNIGSVA